MSMPAELPAPMISDPRKTSLEVHTHLRRLIVDGVIPPGAVLKQAELARMFHVSRTPMREAFRMLQAEGLIEADLNQRGRVRDLDPQELDELYGARIVLESLGVRITTGRLTKQEITAGRRLLTRMDRAQEKGDMATWVEEHRAFHALCMARAGSLFLGTARSYSERSERYVRLYQQLHPEAFALAHAEHEDILSAVQGPDADVAGNLMAQHLQHTSVAILADVAPGMEPRAIQHAIAMATVGQAPARSARGAHA